jgi:TolA-binding protein
MPYIGAGAALLLAFGCASGEASLRQDVSSMHAEVRTLQRENAELARRVEALVTQVDVLSARLARVSPIQGADAAPESAAVEPSRQATPRPAPTASAAAGSPAAVPVPANLKVVRLEQPPAKPAGKARSAKPAAAPGSSSAASAARAPPVPTETPIQEPSPAALAALGTSSRPPAADAQATLDAARALAGLSRARALEQFADGYPAHARAGEALVDAARARDAAGDPDGSCEDFARAVAEHPASRAAPDAIDGLAACEQRRGRAAEAKRLQVRLAKEHPDSPAGKRARELAPAAQGAAP